jgi:hypothetical protein
MQNVGHAKPAIQGERMKQLSLGMETNLAAPAIALPEDIEAEVIAQLAEAIKTVYEKGEEVDDEESRDQ